MLWSQLSRATDSVLFRSLIFPVCVDAAGYRSIQLRRGGCSWACICAQVLPSSSQKGGCGDIRAFGCTKDPIRVSIRAKLLPSPKGVYGDICAFGCTMKHTFPRRALLAAPNGEWQTSKLRPVELPRLACRALPEGRFAVYYVRSILELLGRTAGRLGYIRPDSAHAIGGTAELALRYST